jgi:hypothetical protein
MPRKATRISFDSSKRYSPKLGLDMTSKVTVKANKLVRTGKNYHPRNNDSKKSRARVSLPPSRASIFCYRLESAKPIM